MCVNVPCDDVVCEGVKVLKSVCDIVVFCCVVWICCLSRRYIDVGYVYVFVL